MARRTKAEIQFDREYDAAFSRHGSCRQFRALDLGKIRASARTAHAAGQSVDEVVKAACDAFEVKQVRPNLGQDGWAAVQAARTPSIPTDEQVTAAINSR